MLRSGFIAAAMALAALPAQADYKSEYKSYVAAIEVGDVKAAIKHGEEAWKQGEAELGDHRVTAILAFNFGNVIYEFAPEKAVPAYARTLDLVERGISDLDLLDAKLALAAAKYASNKGDKTLAAELEGALTASEAAARPASYIAADGWKLLSLKEYVAKKYKTAGALAEKSAAVGEEVAPKPKALLATAYAIAGVTAATDRNRTPAKITRAAEHLDRAIVLFPPQESIDNIHPLFAQAMVWRLSLNVLAKSEGKTRALDKVDKDLDADAMCRWQQARPADCEIKWKKRTPPAYSTKALLKGYVGSVLVGYDLNETGVERTVLIAAVNGEALSAPAIESMKNWVLAEPPRPECRKNHIVNFGFELE